MKKLCLISVIFVFFLCVLTSQGFSALPSGYRAIILGMDIESVKKTLASDALFYYRGERDVSLLPDQKRQLIEIEGTSFIDKAWFQFVDDRLYAITLQLDESKIDYGTFFKTLSKKYGPPHTLSPEQTSWQNEVVLMSLERPLSLKYIDRNVYDSLLEASRVEDAAFEITRDLFLETF